MQEPSDIRHGRHCVFQMHAPLVFVTKYSREVFAQEVLNDLRGIFAGVCNDCEAELWSWMATTMCTCSRTTPKVAVSSLVNSL